jgi:hypothetical protein
VSTYVSMPVKIEFVGGPWCGNILLPHHHRTVNVGHGREAFGPAYGMTTVPTTFQLLSESMVQVDGDIPHRQEGGTVVVTAVSAVYVNRPGTSFWDYVVPGKGGVE